MSLIQNGNIIALQKYFSETMFRKFISEIYLADVHRLIEFEISKTKQAFQEKAFFKLFKEDFLHYFPIESEKKLVLKKSRVGDPAQDNFELRNKNAAIIQMVWRLYRVKQVFEKDKYGVYSTLISKTESLAALSLLMFGQHVAAIDESVENPYAKHAAGYHRSGNKPIKSELFSLYFKQVKNTALNLNNFEESHPVVHFKQSILSAHAKNASSEHFMLLENDEQREVDSILSVSFGNANQSRWEHWLASCGAGPSLWRMASTIFSNADESQAILSKKQEAMSTVLERQWHSGLPTTRDALENFIRSLSEKIRRDYPTYILAEAVLHLIQNAPNLSEEAIKRIALIAAITLQFHKKNYDRFSFFLYVIVHEMSLALFSEKDEIKHARFLRFNDQSLETACHALNLSEDVFEETHHFLALPANSGMHSYLLACNLARVQGSEKIKIVGNHYFENIHLHADYATYEKGPNIISFCAGPIVHGSGNDAYCDYPGLNINDVVKTEVVSLTGHVTLIVDATSALYANLHLDEKTRELVTAGKLSIIIFESHQKFGLLHTDQAQYGRVFSILSKNHFSVDYVDEKRKLADLDFHAHLDIRIGAFIDDAIPVQLMESIKERHFRNGEIFYRIDLAERGQSEVQAKNLLFLTSSNPQYVKAVFKTVDRRDSFGHYSSTHASVGFYSRVSPGGSDKIDVLVQWMQILLLMHNKQMDIRLLTEEEAFQTGPFLLSEQVLKMAVLTAFIYQLAFPEKNQVAMEYALSLRLIKMLLDQCRLLQGRVSYQKATAFYHGLRSHSEPQFFMRYGKNYNVAMFEKVASDLKACLDKKILPRYSVLRDALTKLIRDNEFCVQETRLKNYYHFFSQIDPSLLDGEIKAVFMKYDFMTKKGEWTDRFHLFKPNAVEAKTPNRS